MHVNPKPNNTDLIPNILSKPRRVPLDYIINPDLSAFIIISWYNDFVASHNLLFIKGSFYSHYLTLKNPFIKSSA